MELNALRKVTASILGVDAAEISMGMDFIVDLGADSLDVYQIITGVEDELGISIPQDNISNISTVGEAVELIKSVTCVKKP